ncbi:PREDICTED: uncharacterized protein LOC105362507 [Ceratosolen solmsi marchali]|uniref:Uncharacterized protein LOC105362507 n=1 Tax=Ceratosolen solmsi marchali TaxID=326594 RepID=A0AAJ7DVU1_9HYME|nr:PREDICTED: uncharacterized protein LOC105362507 [Ceratosolen solmsi marchali]
MMLTTTQENNRKRKNKVTDDTDVANKVSPAKIIVIPHNNINIKPLTSRNIKDIQQKLNLTSERQSKLWTKADNGNIDDTSTKNSSIPAIPKILLLSQKLHVKPQPLLNLVKLNNNSITSCNQVAGNSDNPSLPTTNNSQACNCIELTKEREKNEQLIKKLLKEQQTIDELRSEIEKLHNNYANLLKENESLKQDQLEKAENISQYFYDTIPF